LAQQEDILEEANKTKVLVAVATEHGSTREIAERIADELRAYGLEIVLQAPEAVGDISEYGAVVLGSAIYTGGWLPTARRFARAHRPALRTVPVWLFSSGPVGAEDPKPLGDLPEIPQLMGLTLAREHKLFGGKLDKQGLGVAERFVTRVVQAPEGDFRDWEAVRAWARSIAASLCHGEAREVPGGER
jgi:menaquinone-dependent protoporphyrinogen oxidase